MGLLDDVMGKLGSGGASGIVAMLPGLLEKAGGLDGLLQRFNAAGLKEQADSWVSRGENKPVSPDQVRQALGDDEVQQVADQAGVSRDEAASGLAGALPGLIDKLTPDGRLPDLDSLKGMLGGLLK